MILSKLWKKLYSFKKEKEKAIQYIEPDTSPNINSAYLELSFQVPIMFLQNALERRPIIFVPKLCMVG